MADQFISLKIPSEKVEKALEGFLKIYPNNETIPDPAWVDPGDGSEAPQIPKYATKSWVTEKVRRLVIRDIHRGLQMMADENAKVALDDGIVGINK